MSRVLWLEVCNAKSTCSLQWCGLAAWDQEESKAPLQADMILWNGGKRADAVEGPKTLTSESMDQGDGHGMGGRDIQ